MTKYGRYISATLTYRQLVTSHALHDGLMRRLPRAAVYVLLVGLPAIVIAVLLRIGSDLPIAAGPVVAPRSAPGGATLDVGLLALQIVAIVGLARLAGSLVARFGQPRVVGEMIAGLVLGPSVLGRFLPGVSAQLFPPASLGYINALAQVGLLIFMFLVGLELDNTLMRRSRGTAVIASHASILAPFVLGTGLSLWLYTTFAPGGVRFVSFALFMGAAMSVTAFPVLARMLAERRMTATPLGSLAIACAAVDDVTAWCILAAVVLVARSGDPAALAITVGGTALYLSIMFTVGRRVLALLVEKTARTSSEMFLAAMMLVTLGSAWITERLGIHALFGAFLVGALLPKTPETVDALTSRLRDLMVVLLLPLYFAFTGLRTTVSLISGGTGWLVLAAVIAVAVAGKLGGSAIAARMSGMRWRESLSLGALMNTRGLMELVILNVGLDIGVLTPTLFAMMVVMALVTTALTAPLLDALSPRTARAGG